MTQKKVSYRQNGFWRSLLIVDSRQLIANLCFNLAVLIAANQCGLTVPMRSEQAATTEITNKRQYGPLAPKVAASTVITIEGNGTTVNFVATGWQYYQMESLPD